MKSYQCIAAAMLLPLAAASCGGRGGDPHADEVRALVQESLAIAGKYYDSISQVSDSASVNRLMVNFDNALTRANYRHSADIYLHMHDGDNDTVATAIMRVVAKKDSILSKKASAFVIISGDTVPVDSLPPVPYRR